MLCSCLFFWSFSCLEFPCHRIGLLYKTTQIDGSIDIMAVRYINVVFKNEEGIQIFSTIVNETENLSSVIKQFVEIKGLHEEDHVFSCATYEIALFRTLRQIVGNENILIIKVDLVERGVRVSNELMRIEDEVEAGKFCKHIGESLQRYTAKKKTLEEWLRGLKKQVRHLQKKVKDCEENEEILKQSLADAEEHREAKRRHVGSVAITDYEKKVFSDDLDEEDEDEMMRTGLSDSDDDDDEMMRTGLSDSDDDEDETIRTGLSDSDDDELDTKDVPDRIKFLLEKLISVGDLYTLTTRLCKEYIKEHFGERGDQVCFEFKTLIEQTINEEVQKHGGDGDGE